MLQPGRNNSTNTYRFGFNDMEMDNEMHNQTGSSYDFGARMYDSRLGRWSAPDPKEVNYPEFSPYNYALGSPIILIDPSGEDVLIAFTGFNATLMWPILQPGDAGVTGEIVKKAAQFAAENGIEFDSRIYGSGEFFSDRKDDIVRFVKEHHSEGEKIIIYGYSWGGDFAVELAEALGDEYTVDLIVTIDATDGILGNMTVDRTIPGNTKKNYNVYQTNESGSSTSVSASDGSSGDPESNDSGTSNFPGSRGGPNTAENPAKTEVVNYDKTGQGITHGNIDNKFSSNSANQIMNTMKRSNEAEKE